MPDYKVEQVGENEYRISEDHSGMGCLIVIILGVVLFNVSAKYLNENPTAQKFLALPFHPWFKWTLLAGIGLIIFFWIHRMLTRENAAGRKRSRIPYLLLTIAAIWGAVGIIKGIKYDYFSTLGIGGALTLAWENVKAAFYTVTVSGKNVGNFDLFMAIISSALLFFWAIQLCMAVVAYILRLCLGGATKARFDALDGGALSLKLVVYTLAAWALASIGGIVWLLV